MKGVIRSAGESVIFNDVNALQPAVLLLAVERLPEPAGVVDERPVEKRVILFLRPGISDRDQQEDLVIALDVLPVRSDLPCGATQLALPTLDGVFREKLNLVGSRRNLGLRGREVHVEWTGYKHHPTHQRPPTQIPSNVCECLATIDFAFAEI
jgi:hypothetical protein